MSTAHVSAGEVWNGIALDTDPRVREFARDPVEYMERRAQALRTGNFEAVRDQLTKQRHPLIEKFRKALSAKRHKAS
ncbi:MULTISPECIES: hypothetical protein [Streptomycetaceae]|uniref:Uncharacterized protein n=1 Tax=Streptantibioticus cattleyicolor (strain ATCC 35852 / DSM 46488 / JCM 4925 / NBRC 14057 / NRRL 8057) TaxID=1003195 RepID=G8X2Q5_STREN|nr:MULTISPECIES: hypothetical protein [Streptomycetaceae]AEW95646.1 hypothetical protein SCATT_32750 [Streptantibioticus cattleyicolor NRRL 8057 = DSM 46488]MYS60191.1 hypothetical protein [Streptomyces sp. SID5468]